MKPTLSLIIPCYNEGEQITATINQASRFLKKMTGENQLIIVNDGSTDSTSKRLSDLKSTFKHLLIITHSKNMGKGAAIRSGVDRSTGVYVAFVDADLATPLTEVSNALRLLQQGSQFVIATRKHPQSTVIVHQPLIRESLGKVFTFLSNRILNLQVSDVTCGLKAWDKATAKKIWSKQTINNWSYDAEIIYLARKYDTPITELPIKWADKPASKVKPLRDGLSSLIGLIQIRLNNLTHKYD